MGATFVAGVANAYAVALKHATNNYARIIRIVGSTIDITLFSS